MPFSGFPLEWFPAPSQYEFQKERPQPAPLPQSSSTPTHSSSISQPSDSDQKNWSWNQMGTRTPSQRECSPGQIKQRKERAAFDHPQQFQHIRHRWPQNPRGRKLFNLAFPAERSLMDTPKTTIPQTWHLLRQWRPNFGKDRVRKRTFYSLEPEKSLIFLSPGSNLRSKSSSP